MQIKDIAIDELKVYENNPRFNNNAVEAVANSISEFGFKVPIIIDKDNIIVAGHTRLKAAQRLGLETVPCIVADDLTPEQIKAFRLADNKTAELAEWDFSKLEEELEDLKMNFDMSEFGFVDNSNGRDLEQSPDEFEEYGEDIKTEHKCPKCGYEW
jgi:site-specific DNA-methyltransferase (adenine-specific)